jgi:hypothetical protein
MSELEIIAAIGGHCPNYIQRALLSANVKTIQEALSFLNKPQIMDSPRHDLFKEFLKKGSEQKPTANSLQEESSKSICQDEGESSETKQKGKEQQFEVETASRRYCSSQVPSSIRR